MKGYNARALAARYAALEAAFFTAGLLMHTDTSEALTGQYGAFAAALDPTPAPTYRDEAVTCGLHPPEGA